MSCASACMMVAFDELGAWVKLNHEAESEMHSCVSMEKHKLPKYGTLVEDILDFVKGTLFPTKRHHLKSFEANVYYNLSPKQSHKMIKKCHNELKPIAERTRESLSEAESITQEEFDLLLQEGKYFILPTIFQQKRLFFLTPYLGGHYLLVRRCKDNNKELVIMDPATGSNYLVRKERFFYYFFNHKKFSLKNSKHNSFFGVAIALSRKD